MSKITINDIEIDISKITRIFPAVMVHLHGESALVSIEWAESKSDKIEIDCYVLALDTDPIGEVPINRTELKFDSKDELFEAINIIASS